MIGIDEVLPLFLGIFVINQWRARSLSVDDCIEHNVGHGGAMDEGMQASVERMEL